MELDSGAKNRIAMASRARMDPDGEMNAIPMGCEFFLSPLGLAFAFGFLYAGGEKRAAETRSRGRQEDRMVIFHNSGTGAIVFFGGDTRQLGLGLSWFFGATL
ncbi:hypothetical protein TIFTF001_001599 [Ficus carica]|uniref:Uncharacterized protein n=1 Tax=Ficus carica TaxID=3494 RepID=A0AA87Z7H5_FICCA|nr:hypothetical protein TIFTF001_001599 [Ficus carica]